MSVRCKFRVISIAHTEGSRPKLDADGKPVMKKTSGGHEYPEHEPCPMATIKLAPVYGNGDPQHENTKFWQASPSGSFELGTVNVAAVEQLRLGGEYYIDITPAK